MLRIEPRALKNIGKCATNMLISLATFKLFLDAEYYILITHHAFELHISSFQFLGYQKIMLYCSCQRFDDYLSTSSLLPF